MTRVCQECGCARISAASQPATWGRDPSLRLARLQQGRGRRLLMFQTAMLSFAITLLSGPVLTLVPTEDALGGKTKKYKNKRLKVLICGRLERWSP